MENNPEELKQKIKQEKKHEQKERASVFIDSGNFYHWLRGLGVKNLDLQNFVKEITRGRELQTVFYYTVQYDRSFDEKRYQKHQRFLAYLSTLPQFKTVFCTLRKITDSNGNVRFEVKGDDVHLANDMLVGAYENKYDVAVLVSGDEDFKPVVRTVKRLKKKVENIFFRGSSSPRLRSLCNASENMSSILSRMKKAS